MTTRAKLKQLTSNWRQHSQNYIGSLGYYLMCCSLILIAIKFYLQLSQYILYTQPASSINKVSPSLGPAYQPGLLESLWLYGLGVVMILVTAAIVILIPYVFGYFSAKIIRRILSMVSLKLNFSNLFKFKYGYALIVMPIVLLTIYDYDLTIEGNWYAALLLLLNFAALLLFWLQSLLVKFWKIKISQVY